MDISTIPPSRQLRAGILVLLISIGAFFVTGTYTTVSGLMQSFHKEPVVGLVIDKGLTGGTTTIMSKEYKGYYYIYEYSFLGERYTGKTKRNVAVFSEDEKANAIGDTVSIYVGTKDNSVSRDADVSYFKLLTPAMLISLGFIFGLVLIILGMRRDHHNKNNVYE